MLVGATIEGSVVGRIGWLVGRCEGDVGSGVGCFVGSFGLFFTLFLLFLKFLPMVAIAEVKSVMPQADPHWDGYHDRHGDDHHDDTDEEAA